MSFVITRLQEALRHGIINKVGVRCFSRGTAVFQEKSEAPNNEPPVDPAKDRRNPVPVETSIRYLASDAYKETYGSEPVWKPFRRNHKGAIPPKKTRRTCIKNKHLSKTT
ncbi:hypothetical protein G9C98_007609 [Cotesia typhae]|uniref:Uncharacterized protein n=1 Tax=Cotesia typhae TaxID=2053667 RepID=A0A8J5V6M5_9HYME|nr:hypothetical protein G9C98_007609 [Cotesia typhae]